jgi:SAM-dependent methyltransferase
MSILSEASPALDAYESLAAHYDLFTAGYDHRRWIAALDGLARDHGLRGRRVLDLGCGTGHAIEALVERGYEVVGCDLSPAMIAAARERHPDADLRVADMRSLPDLGRFDLVLCLDDAVNYLLDEQELGDALSSIRSALADTGLLIFDVNTSLAYETAFARDRVVSDQDRVLAWRGGGLDDRRRIASATIEIFNALPEEGTWTREQSVHVQRYWRDAELAELIAAAGMRIAGRVGQRTGAVLDRVPDPSRHSKVVYVVRAARRSSLPDPSKGGAPMMIVEP